MAKGKLKTMTGYEQYERDRYKGMPALLIARASTLAQEVSTRDQFTNMRMLVEDIGAKVAGEMAYEGVSASKTWNRRDLEEIAARKKNQGDFKLVIWYDPTRLTRGGAGHGHAVLYKLRELKLRTLFSLDRIYNLPQGDQLLTTAFEQARIQAVMLAANTCRGAQSAIEENRMLGPPNTWYGVDRLYLMPDMTPRHILRTMTDGSQTVYDVDTETDGDQTIYKLGRLLQTFASINGQQTSRYRKQGNDFVFAIPGDPVKTSAIYSMFRWAAIDRDGRPNISRALNDQGILAPWGGLWTPSSVYNILNQPIYLGYHYLNQSTCSSNRTRADGGAKPVIHEDPAVEAGCIKPPMRWNKRDGWLRKEQPFMAPFFGDEGYRNLMQEFVEERLDTKSSRRGTRGNMNKHRRSEYILTDILETQHSSIKMSGRKTGNCKYYYPKNYLSVGMERNYASVRAEKANQVVVDALAACLRDRAVLTKMIGRSIEDHRSKAECPGDERKHLEGQIGKLKREQKFITKRIHIIGESEAEKLLVENRDQQDKLKLQLDMLNSSATDTDCN